MTHDIADWMITVYALGELDGEELEAVERAMAEDPDLAARVEAIRRQAEDVANTLSSEPLPEPRPRFTSTVPRRLAAIAGFAAIIAIAWGASWGVQPTRRSPARTEVAVNARTASQQHYFLAFHAMEGGDFAAALDLADRALQAWPGNEQAAELRNRIALALGEEGSVQQIKDWYETTGRCMVEQARARAEADFHKGVTAFQRRRMKEAVEAFEAFSAYVQSTPYSIDLQELRELLPKYLALSRKGLAQQAAELTAKGPSPRVPRAPHTATILNCERVLDGTKIDLDFTDASLEDILGFVREYAKINIEIDEEVRREGLADKKITFQMREAVLRNALNLLLRQYRLGYTYNGTALVVVKPEHAGGAPVARVHDVRDLLRPIKDFVGPTLSLQSGEGEGASPSAAFLLAEEPRAPYNDAQLTKMLKEHIAVSCPAGSSDDVSVTLSSQGQLVVVNTPEVQREVDQFLQGLRSSSATAVAWSDADTIRFPTQAQWEQVRSRRPLTTLQEEQSGVIPYLSLGQWERTKQSGFMRHEYLSGTTVTASTATDARISKTVVLHADAASEVFRDLVNNDGVISASSLALGDGAITLGGTGDVALSGSDDLTVDRFALTEDRLNSSARWGTDSNEDVFGGRDIIPATRSGLTLSMNGQLAEAARDRIARGTAEFASGTAFAGAGQNLKVGIRPGTHRSRYAIDSVTAQDTGMDPYRDGFYEGGETGVATTADVLGHAAQITLSGGIDIDATWRSDDLSAILNRERGLAAPQTSWAWSDSLDRDINADGTVDIISSGFVGPFGEFGGDSVASRLGLTKPMTHDIWSGACDSPGAMALGAPQLGDLPVLGSIAAITAPDSDRFRAPAETPGTEGYAPIVENPFVRVPEEALSTFSIDVDTASYANVRRHLHTGKLPPPDAVRIEELVNYFPYDYAPPTDGRPFAVHLEMASCPWNKAHRLLRVGLKGRVPEGDRPSSNLVFLIDVSGSMQAANKLPLVQAGLRLLVKQMTPRDRIAIVTYAGASGLALASTPGDQKERILEVLQSLRAEGSTNGASGVELAYQIASNNFITGGTNRVILATDGDWNVGVTSQGDLVRLIEEKARTGVFLTVLGFGMGNLKDDTLEKLADKGNGHYAYVDSLSEARKVLVEEMGATLVTIAKDVKVQIEFNPARVAAYRLIGYENRVLARQDFDDDKKDAGEIGAGHTVTAFYEVIPVGEAMPGDQPPMPPLRYQTQGAATAAAASNEACLVKLRYKAPDKDTSELMEIPLEDKSVAFDEASGDFRFAASVAGYGLLLRGSKYAKGFTWDGLAEIASGSTGRDPSSHRAEFLDLLRTAKGLAAQAPQGGAIQGWK